ncbi:hypothetical protein AUEXF2481DRAFT_5100 [Aureobasidium subglaciale EXF-2481]|uniref:Mid2 domain-containing protein n=1 Tax=Aureobasidium subglaciale (strain EXF-2481) TaxID=1043005 RepID=A0A074YHE0_AURSE|nr:uncharacterized protein AUEXF2481DRAFT_5100 [Aureobasidium subglaciale EXF-2481]KEQ95499.1 hypothetical protein AUEXF2481DRAFT_5100 [Aureobasidium subglaciale EXF-2481]
MCSLFPPLRTACTLLFLVGPIVQGQTTTRLPAAPSYQDGVFSSPDTAITQIVDKGVEMNVTWATSYESVNLYLIFGQDYTNPRGLRISTTDTFYLWTIDDFGNNSLPFSFRAVNAAGTSKEQAGGGFYTGQFWIRDRSATTTTTTSSAVPTTTTTRSSAVPTASESVSSTVSTTATTLQSTSAITITPVSTTSTTTVSSSASASAPTSTTSSSDSSSQRHLVIGVGVGIGVGVAALLIGAFVLWRRHNNHKRRKIDEISAFRADSLGDQKSERSFQMSKRPGPSHLSSYELAEQPKRSPVEVDG